MKSIYAYTEEIDDIELAVEELEEQVKGQGSVLKNSCGIVLCDYDVDTQELTDRLKETFDFPIVGCVSIGMLNKQDGYSEMSIHLMVITADDCQFHVGMTEEIVEPEKGIEQVKELYKKLSGQETEKEKLIFSFVSPWKNFNEIIYNEEIIDTLDEISQGVPVFGGCAGDNFQFKKATVFFDGTASMARVALILISGNIKPLIKTEFSISEKTISKYKVTKSEGRNVFTLNNRSIKNVLDDAGLVKADSEPVTKFLNTPFISTVKTKDGDLIDRLTGIYFLDHKAEFGNFMRNIVEGSELSICMMSKDVVESTVKSAFDSILEQINKESEYRYSTIICISCVARYCLMIADKNAEARSYEGSIPGGMNLMGFYSFGEFCPVKGKKTGKQYNAYNNETFSILAI